MSSSKASAAGILRKGGNDKASKRNVSFRASTSEKYIEKPGQQSKKGNRLSMMNDDEEDAFDPQFATSGESDEKKIREARSKRALKRVAAPEDDVIQGSEFNNGEEVADERHSLFHEQNYTNVTTDDGQGGEKDHCPIEPFNMTSEREDGTGYFDGDTYIFRKGRGGEEEDAWLDGLDDGNQISAAGEERQSIDSMVMMNKKSKKNREKNASNDTTKERIYNELNQLLATDSETVMQALSRYGAIIKREKKQKASQGGESASKKALNRLTELSNLCMMKFDDNDIYQHDRKHLQQFLSRSDEVERANRKRQYFGDEDADTSIATKRSKGDGATKKPTDKCIQWEYRGNQDGSIHGPYTTKQMLDWIKVGYFVGDMAVDIRIIPATGQDMVNQEAAKNQEDVVNDLLGDLEDSDDDGDDTEKPPATWLRSDEVDFSIYL